MRCAEDLVECGGGGKVLKMRIINSLLRKSRLQILTNGLLRKSRLQILTNGDTDNGGRC